MAQNERYVWSVFPSLAAWPALMMEPAPGSLCIALLLVRSDCALMPMIHQKNNCSTSSYGNY